jgi:hypothetical protein
VSGDFDALVNSGNIGVGQEQRKGLILFSNYDQSIVAI